MAKLSLSEVSKRFNISRSTLYRAIKEGRLSRSADGQFDMAEVIRCFGEPSKKNLNEPITIPKDDADLRQLVDFMKKEIESYKEREERYLDQIDRFQLLLGHKESSEKMSHDTSQTNLNDAPCDTTCDTSVSIENTRMKHGVSFHDTSSQYVKDAPQHNQMTHDEIPQKTLKKRGLFGRVLHAVLSDG